MASPFPVIALHLCIEAVLTRIKLMVVLCKAVLVIITQVLEFVQNLKNLFHIFQKTTINFNLTKLRKNLMFNFHKNNLDM